MDGLATELELGSITELVTKRLAVNKLKRHLEKKRVETNVKVGVIDATGVGRADDRVAMGRG